MDNSRYDPDLRREQLQRWQRKAAELEYYAERLAEERFTGTSDSGLVTAEVDGNGRLLDISVSDEALEQAHPQNIGPDAVEAIAQARATAAVTAMSWTESVVGEVSA
ncbi:hypothetical protein A8924_0476 [Saccharopolyspora erythraea NRRL 2338]|uniref:Uncharacterized protein n=2 Tax=Saccharopolyspora erythraea TaxID=1836 RepID=A4F5X0_SACEN|nr:YbaB/EbfC family nucleoid-associated protein [Saccharopolyspora erythraea]EQD84226.1 hypothetical protein N599_21255 [Saccharopolyspora erythraea D]PFG93243.1 hypothetical protein A8924_0476 [Saccharopolyspora erythraea NRRL 2338]QRK90096.1 YbaB/EbfC family nucleoid-associated protein [Saccharopolyspora erythraea]CAL99444.1 hypothetical protein SACE_0091 [Saccharopolyspora erythraea NRRL 2338]